MLMLSRKPSSRISQLARTLSVVAGAWLAFGATASLQGPPSPPAAAQGAAVAAQGARGGGGGGREGGGFGRGRAMDPTSIARLAEIRKSLEALTPVTDAMLREPAPGDWLMWRRTYDGWGHSPLDQINRENVSNLKVAWAWGMDSSGYTEFTPLVHDGILFLWNFGEKIQALDATNGNLLWEYTHPVPDNFVRETFYRTKRSLAIGDNKLIFPTVDMHIVALDVKTGEPIWDVSTDTVTPEGMREVGAQRVYNGGPLVVNGKVIMGASGCAPGGAPSSIGCYITAHDLQTGRELWRFNTIAQPGEPGGDTWNNLPADKRWGASVWTPPSYDQELNLLIVGTGSPYPWSSIERGTYNPEGGGHHGDILYTSSTLALNPDTGELVWYYAHLPNDTFDQDYAFERLIMNITWQGQERRVVMTAGKPAVIEVLDARTGEFLYAKDPGAQNIFTFDPVTGVKTLLPPGPPEGIRRCPNNNGARNYLAGSYSPLTNLYYISVNDVCTGKGGDTPDRMIGMNVDTGEFEIDNAARIVQSSAKLTTAGGLLFSGAADRYFRAFDDRDGKVLWETRLQDIPNAFPITYAVDGKQYIAMIAGNPGLIGNGAARATGEFLRPTPTSVLWVWTLP
jgi:alcohol dehydrogenase (cytochrome c)